MRLSKLGAAFPRAHEGFVPTLKAVAKMQR